MSNQLDNALQLINFISSLPDFSIEVNYSFGYKHMGAVVSDAILQSGLNYRTVVQPRIQRILTQYPEAYTLTSFLVILEEHGVGHVLDWHHPEKPRRLYHLITLLLACDVDTVDDLRAWLQLSSSCQELQNIRGVGPKTVDYLKNLSGLSTIAVDRHIQSFVNAAGIRYKQYKDTQTLIVHTADILKVPYYQLDYAIWLYTSDKRQPNQSA